ncbi:UNVERIFIED_CONTAM: hypothetical protein GTU68_007415, partial [Idotea baltica]|nr:hypothetical protein [Idotea baltica]
LGKLGEQVAAEFLQAKGYEILECNWRHSRAEIDIIARLGEILVVVEVKSRLTDEFAEPASTVSRSQMTRLADAFAHYADEKNYLGEYRFDVIGVVFFDPHAPEIKHYEDAFFPY